MKKRYEKPLTIKVLGALPDDQIDISDFPELARYFRGRTIIISPQLKTLTLRLIGRRRGVLQRTRSKGIHERMAAVLASYMQAQQSK